MKKTCKMFLLIILPLIIGIILFYHKPVELNLKQENNQTWFEIPDFSKLNDEGGFGRTIRTIFSTPFDLKYYTIKIKDISNYEGNIGDSGYILSLNGKELDFLKARSEIKETLLIDKYLLDTRVKIIQGNAPTGSEVIWVINFYITARPGFWDTFAKVILFIIAWNSLFFLCREIIIFIRK